MSKRISELPVADPLDGSERIPLEQAGTTKRVTSDSFRKLTVLATGPNDSISTRVNDALTAGGENTHVTIEGDAGLIDAPIILQNRYQRVEVSGETHLWVPSGYAQSAFKLYASGGVNNYNMSIGMWGTLREKDDANLAYGWTAFEVHADGGSPNYPRIDTGPFVWYAGVGLKLRLSGTTHSITGGRFSCIIDNPQVGVEFVLDDPSRDPSIGRNYFDMAQCQYSSATEQAFRNVLGQGNVFVCPTMWDVGTHAPGSTPFEVSAKATDTVIIGGDPHLDASEWLDDQGVNTTVVSPKTSSFTRENHRINLSASAMEASMGSPTRTTVAFRYPTWGFSDVENQGASGFLADDGISHGSRTTRVYLVMSNTDGNTGNVTLNARVQQPRTDLADGAWPNHSETTLTAAGVSLPTDGRPQLVDMGTLEHLSGPREFHVQAYREPGDASDDMAGSVYLWKVKAERE